MALLDAPMAAVHRSRRGLAVTNRRERKYQLNVGPQLWLVCFDEHDRVAALVHNRLRHVALGQEGVHPDDTTF
jgi:hypothetical protein